MNDKLFKIPVIINLGSDIDREVGSVREALDILGSLWPADRHDGAYDEAVNSCSMALNGNLPVDKARDAFSAAAWEAEIFVSDLPRLNAKAA